MSICLTKKYWFNLILPSQAVPFFLELQDIIVRKRLFKLFVINMNISRSVGSILVNSDVFDNSKNRLTFVRFSEKSQ